MLRWIPSTGRFWLARNGPTAAPLAIGAPCFNGELNIEQLSSLLYIGAYT